MKEYYFTGKEDILAKYGFKVAEYNPLHFYKYVFVPIEADMEAPCYRETNRILYYYRETKEIIAYNEYWDEQIEMNEQWIADLINNNLIKEK